MDKQKLTKLLVAVKRCMEDHAVLVDGEWGSCRNLKELLRAHPDSGEFLDRDVYDRVCAALEDLK